MISILYELDNIQIIIMTTQTQMDVSEGGHSGCSHLTEFHHHPTWFLIHAHVNIPIVCHFFIHICLLLLSPECCICVEHQTTPTLLPFQLDFLLKQSLPCSSLVVHVIVQCLMPLQSSSALSSSTFSWPSLFSISSFPFFSFLLVFPVLCNLPSITIPTVSSVSVSRLTEDCDCVLYTSSWSSSEFVWAFSFSLVLTVVSVPLVQISPPSGGEGFTLLACLRPLYVLWTRRFFMWRPWILFISWQNPLTSIRALSTSCALISVVQWGNFTRYIKFTNLSLSAQCPKSPSFPVLVQWLVIKRHIGIFFGLIPEECQPQLWDNFWRQLTTPYEFQKSWSWSSDVSIRHQGRRVKLRQFCQIGHWKFHFLSEILLVFLTCLELWCVMFTWKRLTISTHKHNTSIYHNTAHTNTTPIYITTQHTQTQHQYISQHSTHKHNTNIYHNTAHTNTTPIYITTALCYGYQH